MVSNVIDSVPRDGDAPPVLHKVSEDNYWTALPTDSQDIIIIPSIPIEPGDFDRYPSIEHYEERHFFSLFLLRHAHSRVFFFSANPMDKSIVQYYLGLLSSSSSLPHPHYEHKHERSIGPIDIYSWGGKLFNICLNDHTEFSLVDKIQNNITVLDHLKPMLAPNSYILCYRTTGVEESIAQHLGSFLYASPARLDKWGTKSGSRAIFDRVKIPYALGTPLLHDVNELGRAIHAMIAQKSSIRKVVIKLDDFSAGGGNALLDLSPILNDDGSTPSLEAVMSVLPSMELPFETDTWESFSGWINNMGAIAEEWLEGLEVRAPSAQGVISQLGKSEIISTHEQLLHGQKYFGCEFPAKQEYRTAIFDYAVKVGEALSAEGVRGHWGVDFVTRLLANGDWDVNAIEINLRYTGTTHPHLTMRMLIDGHLDAKSGLYISKKDGQAKYYASADHIINEQLTGLEPAEFLEIMKTNGLSYDVETQTGVVYHMIGALRRFGEVGALCIANSLAEAKSMLARVEEVLAALTAESVTRS